MSESHTGYWYSLVAASPVPEAGESVNVGVLLGNGHAFRLAYRPRLPRLSGLVAPDQIGVFEAVLAAISDRVSRGVPVELLAPMLGPQLQLTRPRRLLREPTEQLVERLLDEFVSTPTMPYRDSAQLLVVRARRRLDEAIERVRPPGVIVERRARLRTLYEAKLDRFAPQKVPDLARALRGDQRDVLLDSIIVGPENLKVASQRTAARISRAFYGFNHLAPAIERYAGRSVRLVGVLHAGQRDDPPDVLEVRSWVKHIWGHDATRVIDGNEVDVEQALAEEAAWAKGAA